MIFKNLLWRLTAVFLVLYLPASASASLPESENLAALSTADRALLLQAAGDPRNGILMTDDQGRVLFARNPDTPRVPASILKILTSLAALTHLGPDHRFLTRAAWDTGSSILYLQGTGDPLLVSEVLKDFCRQIARKTGRDPIHKIILDQTYFSPDIRIPGTGRSLNPYDATTGALCANFNTIHVTWDTGAGTVVSAEPQTPLLDVFKKRIQQTGVREGRILLEKEWRLRYPGLLMAHFFENQGIPVVEGVGLGKFKTSGGIEIIPLASPYSLEQIVKKLLEYSNNFIANQLLMSLGAHIHGPPATLEKGVAVVSAFSKEKLGWNTVQIVEGSGLSRKNRVTPSQMASLLKAFMPYHELMRRTDTQYYKTGTLTGIRTRAGYFIGTDHRLYPFVIMK